MTRLKYIAKCVTSMHPSEDRRGGESDYNVQIESAEETCAEVESLMARIEAARGLVESSNSSPSEKSDLERARDELAATLRFKVKLLRSSLNRLGEERSLSDRTVSLLQRELGKERGMLTIEKQFSENREREYLAQIRIGRLSKELTLQQSRARAIGEALDLFGPVLEKATVAAAPAIAK
jgi:hypothetical protein